MQKIVRLCRYLLCIFLLCFSVVSFASSPYWSSPTLASLLRKFYLGIQLGYSNVRYGDQTLAPGYVAEFFANHGISTRIVLGYKFNPYVATELTTIFYSRPSIYHISGNGVNEAGTAHTINNNLLAILVRGIWPVVSKCDLYVALGPGLISRRGITIPATGDVVLKQGMLPTGVYGAGVEYFITPGWAMHFSALFTLANSSDQLPSSFVYGAGLTYYFR